MPQLPNVEFPSLDDVPQHYEYTVKEYQDYFAKNKSSQNEFQTPKPKELTPEQQRQQEMQVD